MDTIKERKMQHSSWHALIKEQLPEGYFGKINQFMDQVYAQGTVYPPNQAQPQDQ